MEKPIFGWAASAITGSDSSARAEANSVRFTFFMVGRPFIVFGKTRPDDEYRAGKTVENPQTPQAQICRRNVTAWMRPQTSSVISDR
jgi:hypothetical protein